MEYLAHHGYQRRVCELGSRPIINIGCSHDPANLGRDFGAVNMDIATSFLEHDFARDVPNFVQGHALDTKQPDGHYGTVILGELIEHMTYEAATRALEEAKRILIPGGLIGITWPMDRRPYADQCVDSGEVLTRPVETVPGSGVHRLHVTVWEDALFRRLVEDVGLSILNKTFLTYGIPGCETGWGAILWKGE